jgi:hypothetical protein
MLMEKPLNKISKWRRIGVQGVPFFVFDNKYAVSGAQHETFVKTGKSMGQGIHLKPSCIEYHQWR